mmetsp:Transcript_14351/g.17721  ORF Transcript_14351/g.17721 Transcript_14351/m.17721 type:complete len:210 (+) Transcript_14351:414-1043(+)|eukprot:CAMPEP_0204842600 /NCGR_PEP_ID=MMETSP1346-20131115/47196_1 /ASSEMBLY_ACC=CAM_ASM_000771 /TAXON_ID=215587 /ORGANISM="Aplanochytrium stocchinoi, Strain GSBS06" /LENGTH=209 /DNA_ID=CAMNT_0051981551 /DNA_START=461 /DNA_END=1090 /DNA_ORIENTATION=-
MGDQDDKGNIIKVVAVGDAAVGKTCLLISYTTNKFPAEYVPTVFDNYETTIPINGDPFILQLWDTAGSEHFDMLRPLSYNDTHAFIVCYSMTDEDSLKNVESKWIPDIRAKGDEGTPIVVVGNKLDDEAKHFAVKGEKSVPAQQKKLKELAEKLNVQGYYQVSALTQQNLTALFEKTVELAVNRIIEIQSAHQATGNTSGGGPCACVIL